MTTAAKPSSFFKVFLSDRSSERLQIPNAFVALTHLKERVPQEFTLRNGRGRDWRVKTSLIGGRLFFEDGWRRFVQENALQHQDFIVFQSAGNNMFKFRIFELSSYCEKPEMEHENEITDVMVSNMDIDEEEDRGANHADSNEDKNDDDYDFEEDEDQDEDSDDNNNDGGEEKAEAQLVKGHPRDHKAAIIRKKGTARSSGSKANDHLNEYKAIAQKYFFHKDNPYFVAKKFKDRENELHIPYKIIKDFSLKLPETITLFCQKIDISSTLEEITPSMTRWPDSGKLHTWKDGRVCILGWSTFCRKNKIEANDTCICEIVLGEGATVKLFQVHVVRKQSCFLGTL